MNYFDLERLDSFFILTIFVCINKSVHLLDNMLLKLVIFWTNLIISGILLFSSVAIEVQLYFLFKEKKKKKRESTWVLNLYIFVFWLSHIFLICDSHIFDIHISLLHQQLCECNCQFLSSLSVKHLKYATLEAPNLII